MRSRGLLLMFGALLLASAAFARVTEIDKVRTIYIEPLGSDPASVQFQQLLKQELVHQGFSVIPKAENADAVLSIELVFSQQDKVTSIETFSALKGSEDDVFWSLSSNKSGPDKDKLIMNEARKIASNLKGKKTEVFVKKTEDAEKETKRQR